MGSESKRLDTQDSSQRDVDRPSAIDHYPSINSATICCYYLSIHLYRSRNLRKRCWACREQETIHGHKPQKTTQAGTDTDAEMNAQAKTQIHRRSCTDAEVRTGKVHMLQVRRCSCRDNRCTDATGTQSQRHRHRYICTLNIYTVIYPQRGAPLPAEEKGEEHESEPCPGCHNGSANRHSGDCAIQRQPGNRWSVSRTIRQSMTRRTRKVENVPCGNQFESMKTPLS